MQRFITNFRMFKRREVIVLYENIVDGCQLPEVVGLLNLRITLVGGSIKGGERKGDLYFLNNFRTKPKEKVSRPA